jgi:S-DNA-T family DNA segregation ATPase FtsK/SpoIIIE
MALHALIVSILFKNDPSEVKFLFVDPKKVELSIYAGLRNQYLLEIENVEEEIITKPESAEKALQWLLTEMERRYELLGRSGVRNNEDYNQKESDNTFERQVMPDVIVIWDELADFMLTSGKTTENRLSRLAAMGRAAGIHLIVATQRPSSDVVTGLIKINFPSRICFQVPSKVDSRVILDQNGAESLLGKGDMLYLSGGGQRPVRIQGAFISQNELERIISHIGNQPCYH